MFKRKFLATLLTVALAMSLTACGGTEEEEDTSWEYEIEVESGDDNNYVEETYVEIGDETDEESAESNIDNNEIIENVEQTEVNVDSSPQFSTLATIDKTVIADENNIKITVTNMSFTEDAMKLTFFMENNSDQEWSFISGATGYCVNEINGYMVNGGYLSEDIPAGETATDTMRFDYEELLTLGITEIANFKVGFMLTDDNYNRIYLEPIEIETSVADVYDDSVNTYRAAVQTGVLETLSNSTVEFFSEEESCTQYNVSAVSQMLITNVDGETSLALELENNSSELVYVSISNMVVNDVLVYGYNVEEEFINPGSRRVISVPLKKFLKDEYESYLDISTIQKMGFSMRIRDLNYNDLAPKQAGEFVVAE